MLNKDETHRIAAATNALRPDWPMKNLITFIDNNLNARTYRETAVALAWVASDPISRTPGRVLENGPWWRNNNGDQATVSVIPTKCGEHPEYLARNCPACETQTDSVNYKTHVASIKAALKTRPRHAHQDV